MFRFVEVGRQEAGRMNLSEGVSAQRGNWAVGAYKEIRVCEAEHRGSRYCEPFDSVSRCESGEKVAESVAKEDDARGEV
jgi:hypothetical protein